MRRLTGWSQVVIRRRARPEQVFHPPAADPGTVAQLAELIRGERSEVVHAHGWIAHSAVPAAGRCGVPVVVGLHDYGLDCARRSRMLTDGSPCAGPHPETCRRCAVDQYGPLRGPLVVAGLRRSERWWDRVDAFVANGEGVARAARQAGVRCEVAAPWVAPSAPPDPRWAPDDLPRGPFVAYVGALAAHKGIATLTEAWGRIPPAPLVALVARPEANAPLLPAGTVVHQHLPHAAVLATLARASVVVVPSHFAEPFGLVAAEAMWVGTPVVASAVGALPALLAYGSAGVLVPPGEPLSLRHAVQDLLADPVRRTELASAARQRLHDLDGTEAITAVYRRVMGAQPQALAVSLRT